MRTIQKGHEPNSLKLYRQQPSANYDNYQDKDTLREQLVGEQLGLCCYCQSRIRANGNDMRVEHWKSQTGFTALQLDYANMLGACRGGQKQGGKSPREKQHCDTRKGDDEICFCLTDSAHPIERYIQFLGDGRIQSSNPGIEHDINEVLNLNLTHLKENRKAVLKAFQQRLTSGKRLDVAKELPKWDGSQGVDLPEYAQVVVYWLRKKQARMAA